jgi:CRP-like cAMP-binding protein
LSDVAHLATKSTARLVATLGPGALLGEIALLKPSDLGLGSMTKGLMLKREGPRLRTATVSALEFCEVYVVEAHAFLAILSNFEPFKIHVVHLAKSRTSHVVCTNHSLAPAHRNLGSQSAHDSCACTQV